jgi:hypothetical protein
VSIAMSLGVAVNPSSRCEPEVAALRITRLVPLYAVVVVRPNAPAESGIVHTGALAARLDDVIEVNGRRCRVVAIRHRGLDTPDGIEAIDELRCVAA